MKCVRFYNNLPTFNLMFLLLIVVNISMVNNCYCIITYIYLINWTGKLKTNFNRNKFFLVVVFSFFFYEIVWSMWGIVIEIKKNNQHGEMKNIFYTYRTIMNCWDSFLGKKKKLMIRFADEWSKTTHLYPHDLSSNERAKLEKLSQTTNYYYTHTVKR